MAIGHLGKTVEVVEKCPVFSGKQHFADLSVEKNNAFDLSFCSLSFPWFPFPPFFLLLLIQQSWSRKKIYIACVRVCVWC